MELIAESEEAVKYENVPGILLGEPDRQIVDLLAATFGGRYTIRVAEDAAQLISLLQNNTDVRVVLFNPQLPGADAGETLADIRRIDRTVPVIVLADTAEPGEVVAAMKSGATDYLVKPFSLSELTRALERVTEPQAETELPVWPRSAALPVPRATTYFGSSQSVQKVRELLKRVGPADVPVLIQGETGVGKEVFAREIHAHSPRAGRTLLKLNCAALPSELVESELFGYERGAFTGAMQRKAGMFELADGGTLLLDEIGDMDFKLQAKLLQVLQDSTFQRLGGKETVRVNVRVIAATHRNLEDAIEAGNFREDLYYRLNVLTVEIPPLRDRQCDIAPLAEFLLNKYLPAGAAPIRMTPELVDVLEHYPWPGNVRELENMMRRLVILRDQESIIETLESKVARLEAAAMPATVSAVAAGGDSLPAGSVLKLVSKAKDAAETQAILNALNQTHWNRKSAARLLHVDYKALLYKMKKLGIDERCGQPEEHEANTAVYRAGASGVA